MEHQVNEATHTFASYSFAAYCEELDSKERAKYFKESFSVDFKDRYDAFGPHNGCKGDCEGTGWVPVSAKHTKEPYRSMWKDAEKDEPSDDGWQFLPCPKCQNIRAEELDEHIVKKGNSYVLKSKKTGRNLGSYASKDSAEKRERQVQYFKHIKEDKALPGLYSGDKEAENKYDAMVKEEIKKPVKPDTAQEHEDALKNADDKREADPDKKQKSKEAHEKKQKEREQKKLLPYEFPDEKSAERSADHLGIHGSHSVGGGVYKPGTSENSLRSAVKLKKDKQAAKGGHFYKSEETEVPKVAKTIKEFVESKYRERL